MYREGKYRMKNRVKVNTEVYTTIEKRKTKTQNTHDTIVMENDNKIISTTQQIKDISRII